MSLVNKVDDSVLIDQVKNGDQRAFKHLVERYEDVVARTVKGMLGDTPEADDVGLEVFVRLYNSLETYRGDAALNTYLTRIAINLSLNELKRRKRKISIFESSSNKESQLADENNVQDSFEIKEIVTNALSRLEPKFRSVATLRLLQGYSVKDTAEILELPEGTVLSRLSRAQKKLKVILEPFKAELV